MLSYPPTPLTLLDNPIVMVMVMVMVVMFFMVVVRW
jgi:hypothetical protein